MIIKNILYVHGFGGNGEGSSAKLLKESLKLNNIDANVIAPTFPYMNPNECVDMIKSMSKDVDLIVASSLGAFYSMQVLGKFKVLVNLAMPENLYKLDEDIGTEFMYDLNFQKDMFFTHYLDSEFRYETFLICGNQDTLATNKEIIEENFYKERIYSVNMGHKLDETGAQKVCELIKYIEEGHYNDIYS